MLSFKTFTEAKQEPFWHNTDYMHSPYDVKMFKGIWDGIRGSKIMTDPKTGVQYGFMDNNDTPLWKYDPKTSALDYGRGKNAFMYIKSL